MDRDNRRLKRIVAFQWIVIVVLVAVLTVCILPYRRQIGNRIKLCFNPVEYFTKNTPDSLVVSAIVNYAYAEHPDKYSVSEPKGLIKDVKALFKPKRLSDRVNNYQTAYYYYGLSCYALKSKDSNLKRYLAGVADKYLDSQSRLNYEIRYVDQYVMGLFYINMFMLTNDSRYYDTCEYLWEEFLDRVDENGLVFYLNDGRLHFVDELGMFVPFLMEYYRLTNNEQAKTIVQKNIDHYYQYGVDHDSGIPFHGFDDNNKWKLGSCNWGRGIGWYALALSFCPEDMFHDEAFDKSVMEMDYVQFPGSSWQFDSSVALMVELYKNSRHLNGTVSLDFIKTHIRTEGIVDSYSGDTFGLNDYSHSIGCANIGNGLLLMLVSR